MPMNNHCADAKQRNLEANDEFRTKTLRTTITIKMLEMRESRARSTAPAGKSSRERRRMLLQRRHLQCRTTNQKEEEKNKG